MADQTPPTTGQYITGTGMDTTVHAPCPACNAARWVSWKVLEVRDVTTKGAVCSACGRGFRADYTDHPGGGLSCEFVQTSGPDMPAGMLQLRRVDP